MKEKSNWKKIFPLWTWITLSFLALLKLYFVSVQHMFAIGQGTHDDQLFMKLASNMLKGEWLGKYNNLTLSKGPFFSMWTAFINLLRIPLLLSEQILYVIATLVLVIALRPVFKKIWPLILIFVFVLFNPMSFTDGVATRAMREGIYQPLTLLFVALFMGLILRVKFSSKKIIFWSIASGLALSALWLTREEGIWVVPFAVVGTFYALFEVWKDENQLLKHKLLLLAIPFALLGISVFSLAYTNYRIYGVFHTVEFKAPEFLNAYGAMTRVKDEHWLPDVPVSTAKRMKLYAVSPAFAKLQPSFEGNLGGRWTKISSENVNSFDINEIRGGWFMWAFRDAVDKAGYYKDGKSTMQFYQQIADEINAACNEKKLDCYAKRSSMNPPWNSAYNKPFLNTIYNGTIFATRLDGFNPIPSESVGTPKSLRFFKEITRNEYSGSNTGFRMNILSADGKLYQLLFPYLAILAFASFVISAFSKKILENKVWIVSLLLLSLIFVRLVLLALIQVTSFPAISTLYLSPIYSIIILFVVLNLIHPISFLIKKFNGRKSE